MDEQQPQAGASAPQLESDQQQQETEQPSSPDSARSGNGSSSGGGSGSGHTFTGPSASAAAQFDDEDDLTPPAFKKPVSLPPAAIDPNIGGSLDGSAAAAAGLHQSDDNASSWSASSDRQLGHGSASSHADPSDRVYPIRSLVNVDQSQATPWSARNSGEHEYFPRFDAMNTSVRQRSSNARVELESLRRSDTFGAQPRNSSVPARSKRKGTLSESIGSPVNDTHPLPNFADSSSDAESENANDGAPSSSGGDSEDSSDRDMGEALYTARIRHVQTEEGHYVITGRDGPLQRCEDEPIHTPGAVQAFGLLIALKEDSEGRFAVHVASENSARIIGYSPQQLFKLENFLDIFSDEQADNILDHIDFIRDDDADVATNGPEVFSVSVRPPKEKNLKLWCAMHVNSAQPDIIICEFELEDDQEHPLRPIDEMTPPAPEDTLYQTPTLEEFNESTEISSKPLRVLRSARKKRGEAGAMQVFDIMSQVQEQLASAPTLDKFLKILVGIVKELTGFHRVMTYQFDASYNGKVVTELVDPMQTRDLYKGLHFPASDIPRQARELYKVNKVRLLYDRDLESARLVCRSEADMEDPLNLTHSYLRAMSPIHLKYLGNMAVRASMSISINAFNELWGLIACHSYGPRGMRVAFPIRKMCRLIGDTASRNIERLSYASRLQARKLINTVPTDKNPSGYIIASSEDLLKLFDADFGMLSIRGETKILGKLDNSQEALVMLEYLRVKKFASVVTTQDIGADFPDLRYPPGFSIIAGMLYVPLSVGGQDFIVFFRKGQVKEVKWAGNPYEKVIKEGTADYLEPRTSFQVWHETVIGKCREWSEEQVETAAVLCLVYGKFIEVWRQKEAALQTSRLTKLLLANSAHEVRTPLNAIINYLEIALEGSLDQETRDNLAKSHSASKSLIYVINDLLDLTMTEEGQDLIKDEIIDFPACFKEATDPFKVDAKRKGITYEVIEHPGLPSHVHGDNRRVRQAIANLTANAIEHTKEGSVKIECFVVEVVGTRVKIEIVVQDTGKGMNNAKLDALFQELEQVSTDDSFDEAEPAKDGRALGLGLAVVARIVRNMDGQLRLKSEEGVGTRFVMQLPFDLPDPPEAPPEPTSSADTVTSPPAQSNMPSVTKSLPPAEDGELTLKGSPTNAPPHETLRERRSFDDAKSIKSVQSLRSATSKGSGTSSMSDADRLIDALSTPLPYGEGAESDSGVQRRSSRSHRHSGASGRSKPLAGNAHADHKERPPGPHRSSTAGQLDTSRQITGMAFIKDSKTPVRPVKVPDEYTDMPPPGQTGQPSGVMFEIPNPDQAESYPRAESSVPTQPQASSNTPAPNASEKPFQKLSVLIAEDDPVNMKILKKRLEKAGHEIFHAMNGEDCAAVYSERPQEFDVVLMDMQMPIVDGLTSTKLIRAFERSDKCAELSPLAQYQGRIPIFAVSASLVEKEMPKYVAAGFDGWILKPIDFKRLNVLLSGITEDDIRNDCLYAAGEWERGGWFGTRSLPNDSSATEVEQGNDS
ncbi:Light-sensor Protein kinase [Pestalotiopsis sp. 9143b]|nr:Light-sensor Protein kinase [Pestalotiopsis sp. 9143b]